MRQSAVRAFPSPPRVSVIVTCFNLGQYLPEAVDSLVAQTFDDFEIVIVDDGSTDDETRRVLDEWSRPGTRLVRSPENRGLPAAKNLGLRHTTGEFVCMVDADDRVHPELLARSLSALDADPSLAFASHWVELFGDESGTWAPTDCDFPVLLDHNTVNGAALVRRSAIELVGGFDESFRDGGEDWDFWIGLVERGLRGRIIPEVLYEYRRRRGSMTEVMDAEQLHPALCRRLASKYAGAYRAHLPALLRRRERDLAALQWDIHRMTIDLHERLDLELQIRRDNAAARQASARDGREARDEQGASREAETVHATDVAPAGSNLEVQRLAAEVEALRTSVSWRVTAPGRALYDMWRRLRGER